jgi:hypothetical protein
MAIYAHKKRFQKVPKNNTGLNYFIHINIFVISYGNNIFIIKNVQKCPKMSKNVQFLLSTDKNMIRKILCTIVDIYT